MELWNLLEVRTVNEVASKIIDHFVKENKVTDARKQHHETIIQLNDKSHQILKWELIVEKH